MNTYKSWIPTVSGCLSFSNIKGAKIPGRAGHPQTHNRLSDDSKNFIYSLQKRNLSDTIYAPCDRKGRFYYLLSAGIKRNPENQEQLVGDIYAYPIESLDQHENDFINSFGKCSQDPTEIVQKLIDKRKSQPSTTMVSFILDRDGMAEFRCAETDSTLLHAFVLEAFSFIKDLVHSHKFHRYDDDAIVVPYPVSDGNDCKWVEKTIRNLHKSIVSSYRNTDYKIDLINAMGRLSYLESFQGVLSSKGLPLHPHINTSTLRTSLDARMNSIDQENDGKSIILQIFVPIFLALLALLIGMTQLLQMPCIDGLTYNKESCQQAVFKLPIEALVIAQTVLEHWIYLGVVLPIVIILLIFLAHLGLIYLWLTRSLGHGLIGWVQRVTFGIAVSNKYGQWLASAWIVILVLTLLMLAYFASKSLLLSSF